MYQEKKEEEHMPALKIRRLEHSIKKNKEKANYSDQKQHKQYRGQQNNNNKRKQMSRKAIVWTIQATNHRNLTQENFDMAKKGKPKRETESFQIAA